ncbi:MAG: GntR family transcriptional regulator [Lentisphaeria bacterium]|nr:GntR family transcriptional regulator [Lentisphaeria bacterium]
MAAVQRKSKSYYIACELAKQLDSGDFTGGGLLPSAREIAEEFSVAMRTADHALRILAATGKVVRKAGSGTFAVHSHKKIRIACLLTPFASNFFHQEHWTAGPIYTNAILAELDKCTDCEYDIISYYDLQRNNFSSRFFHKYDCIIADRGFSDANTRQMIGECGKPGFFIGSSSFYHDPLCQFLPDYMSSVPDMLRKARLAGVKKLVFYYDNISFDDCYHTAAMIAGWQKDECEFVRSKTNLMEAYRIGQTLPANKEIFYVCDSDVLAAGFYRAFLDRGLQSGEFAVSGNGNNEDYGFLPLEGKHLTSVDLMRQEQMKMLLPQLLERVRTNNKTPDVIRVATRLVKRDSTFF